MGAIFLSYAREDRACADALARALEQAGHNVWWDRHIDGGEEFAAEIEAELDKADVVLVAWSMLSVKSRWVRDEAAVGGDTGRLVPVSIDGCLPPMGFRQFHTLDLAGWKGGKRDDRTAELLRSVARRLEAKGKAAPFAFAAEQKRAFAWPGRRASWTIGALVAVLMIAAATAMFLTNRQPMGGPLPKPTIALASFTAPSSDAELHDLARQARDSLSHTLSQTGIPVRLIGSVPQDRRSAGDFMLSGDLSRNGESVVATIRLEEAAQGVTVSTSRFEAGPNDIRYLPERIGAQMAAFFDGPVLLVLDRRHPMDPALMAELLAETDDQLQAYQIRKRVVAKAPDNPNAQMGVAFFTGFVLGELPRDERAQAVTEARQAAERALALAPEFGDTYATSCLLHSETRLAECEDQLRTGKRVDPDAPYLNGFLSALMRNVGRFDQAVELTRLSYTHNPYDHFKIADMLKMFEFADHSDDARELYRQGVRWWPGRKDMFFRNRMFGRLDRGDFEAIRRIEQEVGAEPLPAGYRDSAALVAALRSKSPAAVTRTCAGADAFLIKIRCMLAFSAVGDLDSAFGLADKLYPTRIGRTPAETERIWLDEPDGGGGTEFITSPAAAPMRGDPRYLQLAQRVGLLAYWRSGRLPDFCRKRPEPICAQLLKR
ncbi:TIR domain-containing protein [Sphingomonas sp. URHD0057]|uniref:TIR domain-containing protein n=1 Tax=Sphingomonas sp. URHD0057 TaxID=1380389 RepID=UPI000B2EFD4D|nr:TIR domain-containing protein [Sphingomonas sp. URHD0057]